MKLNPNNSLIKGNHFGSKYSVANKSNDKEEPRIVYDKNPISKNGERSKTIYGAALAGLGFGVRVLAGLMDSGDGPEFVFEKASKIQKKYVGKTSKVKEIGGIIGIIGAFVATCAVAHAICNMPKSMYKADVNTFKKKKDMDVYIKGNAVEKELYNQMNDKATQATTKDEKDKLNAQYMKLRMSKNSTPEFMNKK